MSDLDAIRKRYRLWKIVTFALMTAGFVLLWTGQSWSRSLKIDRNVRALMLVGSFGFAMTGAALYARMKGRSVWFGLLGLLSCIGYLILLFLRKSCHHCGRTAGPFAGECAECRAPV